LVDDRNTTMKQQACEQLSITKNRKHARLKREQDPVAHTD